MTRLQRTIPRDRAMLAVHHLLGALAEDVLVGTCLFTAFKLSERALIVVAGDHARPLDFTTVRPMAIETGHDVIATYIDPFKAGHRFVFDLVRTAQHGRAAWEHWTASNRPDLPVSLDE